MEGPTIDLKEQAVIKALKAGESSAFEQVYRQYFKVLTVFAIKYVGDRDTAEDIVQEVFVNLYAKRTQITFHTSLKSFLFVATRNRSLDFQRTQKTVDHHKSQIQSTLKDDTADHNNLIEQSELEVLLHNAIDQLPAQNQKIFKMSRFEGKSNEEIAASLDLSKRTIETHISNALKKLKERLSGYLSIVILFISDFF